MLKLSHTGSAFSAEKFMIYSNIIKKMGKKQSAVLSTIVYEVTCRRYEEKNAKTCGGRPCLSM